MKKLIGACLLLNFSLAYAQMSVTLTNDTLTPDRMVKEYFMGDGVTISNVIFKGENDAFGIFTDNKAMLGFKSGLIISNGRADILPGKNSRPNTGANFGHHFFFDEDFITQTTMCDGAVLEFDFVPEFDSIVFRFVFGSEEYPEFVGKNFNDAFALLIKPKTARGKYVNVGVLPNGTAVMINNVNSKKNKEWYIDNQSFDSPLYNYLEYDGFTKPIVASMRVVAKQVYHLKVLIADLEDCEYDSGVLLEGFSFSSVTTKKTKPIQQQFYFNFKHNSYALESKEMNTLKLLTDSLNKFEFDSIVIIGHTDNIGDAENNLILSKKRAQTIASYFGDAELKAKKISSYGAGSRKPLQSNETTEGQQANRRVEILFYQKTKSNR